jgi:hypothetical protein
MSKKEASEYEGFHTVSTIVHDHVLLVDQGKGKDVLLHEINREPRYPAAELSRRAGRVITKLIAKEDNTVQDFGTVQSASKEVQMPEEEAPGAVSAPIVGPSQAFEAAPSAEAPSGLMKNLFDKHEDRLLANEGEHSKLHTHDKVLAFLGALGVAGLIVAIISLVR